MEEKDYKKLYEDVVALAKDGLKDGLYLSQSAKAVTEFLFPQLKETEEEKARKGLVRFLINFNNGCYSKPSETEIDSWIKWIDEKCEQKPTDNVEPKFKVGDWVVYNRDDSSREIIQVSDIRDGRYYFTDNIHFSWSIKECDEKSHLWTIQDANDGDVLYFSDETIAIFKDLYNATTFHSYCHIEYGLFVVKDDMPDWWEGKGFQPATKEQRDIFFQKMKEAGYEWDAEKKELRKIEQKSDWSEEDEEMLNAIIADIQFTQKAHNHEVNQVVYEREIDWLKSLKDRVQPQPKQEWSEEDSERLLRIHQFLWTNRKGDTDEIYQQEQDADWIMSLNPQQNNYDKGYNDGYSAAKYNQWKPKKEELEALRKRTYFCEGIDANLDSLYTNLLKL